MDNQVWICGKLLDFATCSWEFMGAFSKKALAVAACTEPCHFIGPATLDVRLPDEPIMWPDCYFPLEKETEK